MFRAIPTNNKICFDKELKRAWKIHEDKLKSIKSSLSHEHPQQFLFLNQRSKKLALQDVRKCEIEKQNRSLLSKMSKNKSYQGRKSPRRKSADLVDRKKTLNEPYRKRELVKIVEQNQEILKRIQTKKSLYNVKKWQQQRKEIERNITLISSFPYKNYPFPQTKVNMWMTDEDFTKKQRAVHSSLSKSRLSLVFSETLKINNSYYLVESYLAKKVFNVDIQNLEKINEKYRLKMSEKQAIELLENKFGGNLKNLLNSLEINEETKTCCLKYNSQSE